MRVYLASPLGFSEATRSYLDDLVALLKRHGFDVFDPWSQGYNQLIAEADSVPDAERRLAKLAEANREIGEGNEKGIRSCDSMVAVLDGVDVDSGTASEIGFAYGLGQRILGLRADFRHIGDNEAAVVNLQVQYWIEASGGSIVSSLEELDKALASGVLAKATP